MEQTPLEGCFVKVGRAKQHRDDLEREIGPLLISIKKAIVVETAYHAEPDEFTLEVRYAPSIRPDLSAIAGDAIHNLRSALDYLIYQSVWKVTGERWEEGQFPLLSALDRAARRDRALFTKLGSYSALVQANQPFDAIDDLRTAGVAGDDGRLDEVRRDNRCLGLLRELSNADKHRLLLPGFARAEDIELRVRNAVGCKPSLNRHYETVALREGTELAIWEANATIPKPQMHVDFDFRPSIGIGGGGDVIEALDRISNKVLRVIREFQPLF